MKPVLRFSKPTKSQVLDSAERIIVTFIGAAVAVWLAQPDKFTKAAVVAAITAGGVAVYQVLKSFFTTL